MTVREVLNGEVVTLDEQAAGLALSINGQDVTAALPHRLLYNMTTFATYLLYWSRETQPGPMDIRLRLATVGTIAIRDAGAAAVLKPLAVGRDEAMKTSTARVEVGERPLLLDFNFGAEEAYALRSDAAERLLPTVDEIVFRHQQAETAQAALVQNYIAKAVVSVHFQPTALDSYDVVLENRFFSDSEVSEWEELSFTLNGTRWGPNRPPFPLLQPEKVLSLPLALRLNRDYVYHFEGIDRIGDRACYVVRFDPVDDTRSLYRGRVWIDQERYVRLKVQSVQTRLTAPVASNEEVQTVRIRRARERPADLPVHEAAEPAAHAARGAQCARRAGGRLLGFPAERRDLPERACPGAGRRAHHVSRHRRGSQAPRQARRPARRQRQGGHDRSRAGGGRHVRSVVRVSGAAVRDRLRELRLSEPWAPALVHVCRRRRRPEPAETENRRQQVRREPGFPRRVREERRPRV